MANNTNKNVIYAKLRAMRVGLGLTQEQFAEWLMEQPGREWCVSQSMVSAWENKNKCLSKANDRWLRGVVGMKGAVE